MSGFPMVKKRLVCKWSGFPMGSENWKTDLIVHIQWGAWIQNIGIPFTLKYWKCWSSDFQWNHLKSEQNGSKKTTLWKTERHQKTEQKTSIGIPNVFWIPAPTVIWKNNLFILKWRRLSTFRLLSLLASVLWSSPPLTSLQGQSSDLFEQVNGHSCNSTV